MTRFEAEAHSFVIRLWRENRDDPQAAAVWRGWIDHVQSGQRHYFQEIPAIQNIIASYVSDVSGLDSVFESIQGGPA
jgi:hypothetical protein